MKQFILQVPDDVHARFKAECAKRKQSMKDVLLHLMTAIGDGRRVYATSKDVEVERVGD